MIYKNYQIIIERSNYRGFWMGYIRDEEGYLYSIVGGKSPKEVLVKAKEEINK